MPRDHLPTGSVTFLFTDIESSTKLLHEASFAEAWDQGRALTVEQAVDLALDVASER